MQNKPALLLSLILACTAAGAEPLNYNIVEFDESVSATVPRDNSSHALKRCCASKNSARLTSTRSCPIRSRR